jgi:hypothetical protein
MISSMRRCDGAFGAREIAGGAPRPTPHVFGRIAGLAGAR